MGRIRFVLVLVLALFSAGTPASDESPAMGHHVSSRTIALSDMGLTEAIVLGERNSEQHLYLPMPEGIRFRSVRFELVATYLQPFAGNAVLTISVNGVPALVRPLKSSVTPVEIVLPLSDVRPKLGILDITVALSTQADASRCYDQRGKGIELAMDTRRTRLVYTFAHDEVKDIQTLLASLPYRPVVLVSGNSLNPGQYESTLRVLQALSGMGLQPELLAVPKIGESVSVEGLAESAALPERLRQAVVGRTRFQIKDQNDIGIWLRARMATPNGLAQIVLDPAETGHTLLAALAASGMNKLSGPWGVPEQWLRTATKDNNNIGLMQLAGYPVLAIGNGDVTKAVKLMVTEWKRIASSPALEVIAAADLRAGKEDKSSLHFTKGFPLKTLTADGEWQIPFDLKDLPKGRWPDAFELNMIAAPGSDGKSPVATVLLNDNLLTAALLSTNGQMTRITARIPLYAVRANNVLKVRVSHRVESGLCSGVSQAMPVQLLPSSFLSLDKAQEASKFFMLAPVLAAHGDIVVPERYLQDATQTLPAVSAFLGGLSVRPDSFSLQVSAEGAFVPKESFVAFEVEPDDVPGLVTTRSGHLVVRNGRGEAVFDSAGMGELAVIQLVKSHRKTGAYVTSVTGKMPLFSKPLEISDGSLAIADAQGARLVADPDDPDGELELDEENRGIKLFFHHYRIWIIGVGVLMLPVLAVIGLRLYYRRRNLLA